MSRWIRTRNLLPILSSDKISPYALLLVVFSGRFLLAGYNEFEVVELKDVWKLSDDDLSEGGFEFVKSWTLYL